MASNEEYGDATTDEARHSHDAWVNYEPLNRVDSRLLSSFLEDKGLKPEHLSRIGARWKGPDTIVYLFPDGLKYRRLPDGKRWSDTVQWTRFKLVKASVGADSLGVVVAEGETDAAALSAALPSWTIAVMPAGAKHVTQSMMDQIVGHDKIVVATDADEAGDEAARLIRSYAPSARRLRPPDGSDWCERLRGAEKDASSIDMFDPWLEAEGPPKRVFSARELVGADLGKYDDAHFFDVPILPQRGMCILHGAIKSLKSFTLTELCKALATGTAFADYYQYVQDDPVRVVMVQFEVPPWDFQRRIINVTKGVPDEHRDNFLDNMHFYHLADNQIPRFKVDDKFVDRLRSIVSECDAQVLAVDPAQRMLGVSNPDKANELDPMLDGLAQLQADGTTVIFAHHNNKSGGRQSKDPYSMSGSQRFGADADSVCSLWLPEGALDDDGTYQRNFDWTLRNGSARGRSIQVQADPNDEHNVNVTFSEKIVGNSGDDDDF